MESMKTFCNDSFIKDLNQAPFDVCSIFDDVDDILWAHKNLYEYVLNNHAPIKTRTVTNKQVPHMNSELRKARNQRNMWRARHFKFRKNKTYRYKYVYWRNKVVSINRRSIREYFDKRCNESNNPRSFYKTILPYVSTNNQSN